MNLYTMFGIISTLGIILSITSPIRALQLFDTELIDITEQTHNKATHRFGYAQKLVMIYMAADNDLRSFAIRNIRQLMNAGSNEPYMHIIVHLDIRDAQGSKITRHYYILEDDYIVLNENDPTTQQMDSGDPNTLISFVKFCIDSFDAQEYILIFWDHGTGYLDPAQHNRMNTTELFSFNPATHKLELDRSEFNSYSWPEDQRGVCWDQSTRNYLTAQKVDYALNACVNYLGRPFDIIAFDACLMGMIEIADLISPYAKISLASEEAILGTGFDYANTFKPIREEEISVPYFAQHVVNVFDETYNRITQDYELSALDLSMIAPITANIDEIATLLKGLLTSQKRETVKRALKVARSNTVHFNEPGYLDLYDLYKNILAQTHNFKTHYHSNRKDSLEVKLREGMDLIEQCIIAHCAGSKLNQSRGLSIYFPERMHSSYPLSHFARTHSWYEFLHTYLNTP